MRSHQSRFILFQIANYALALPAQSVVKVIHTPLSEQIHPSLIHTETYTITLVDLYEKLAVDHIAQANRSNFTIIAQSTLRELIAIPVKEPPDLIELTSESIRALPQSYPHKMLLKLSTQIGVVTAAQSNTIFILDIDQKENVVAFSPTLSTAP